MAKQTKLEAELARRYNELLKHFSVSWIDFLTNAAEMAAEKKQWWKASEIRYMIAEQYEEDSQYNETALY